MTNIFLLVHENTAHVIVQDAIKGWLYIWLTIIETPLKNAALNDGTYINAKQMDIGTGLEDATF